MSKSRYMSINCIFYTFSYCDVFCEKHAYLSRKRESKRKVWKLGVQTATGAWRPVKCSSSPRKLKLEKESRPATAGGRAAARRRRGRDSGLPRGGRRRICGGPPWKAVNPNWPRFGPKIYHILKIFSFYYEEWLSPINKTSSFIKLELFFAT